MAAPPTIHCNICKKPFSTCKCPRSGNPVYPPWPAIHMPQLQTPLRTQQSDIQGHFPQATPMQYPVHHIPYYSQYPQQIFDHRLLAPQFRHPTSTNPQETPVRQPLLPTVRQHPPLTPIAQSPIVNSRKRKATDGVSTMSKRNKENSSRPRANDENDQGTHVAGVGPSSATYYPAASFPKPIIDYSPISKVRKDKILASTYLTTQ